GQPFIGHGIDDLLGDAAAGRPRTNEYNGLIADALVFRLARGQQRADAYSRRALYVIVEAAQLIAVTRQQWQCIVLSKILELQQYVRPATMDCLHEQIHELGILTIADALVAPAHVHRIIEQVVVVGADIEHYGQRIRRADAAAGRIQRQLADRDPHTANTLVSQAEDTLTIGDDDDLDVVLGHAANDVVDTMPIGIGHENAAVITINTGKQLTGLT